MFERTRKYIKLSGILKSKGKCDNQGTEYASSDYIIYKNLEKNYRTLKNIFSESDDIIFREFKIGDDNQTKAFICSIDGLVNETTISDNVLKTLTSNLSAYKKKTYFLPENIFSLVKEHVLSIYVVKETKSFDAALDNILSGYTCLFIDGYNSVLSLSTKYAKTREIKEPDTETVIRGPREGFTETLRENTSLLRRKIKNPDLIFKAITLGKQTRTKVCICYIKGISNQNIINEVEKRLNRIDTDAILESGYIEQFIEDSPFSLFPTIGNSERVDTVVGKILDGRVAILCDGTPFVLTVPHLFIENFQSSEDYYSRIYIVNFLRVLRVLSFFISVLTPAVYVALQTFHQEMIPSVLLVTMAASREGVPFPAMVEALLIATVFEMLRESGIRLPRAVGQAVSIVGALVIGEAAVNAGIISAPIVIVMAITGITSFIVSHSLYEFLLVARFIFILLGGSLGLYGITSGILVISTHLASLQSFGIPFLSPFTPVIWQDMKDAVLRFPLWAKKNRSVVMSPNIRRQGDFPVGNTKNDGRKNK